MKIKNKNYHMTNKTNTNQQVIYQNNLKVSSVILPLI